MPWHYIPDVDAFTIYHRVREEVDFANGNSNSTLASALGQALAGSFGTAVSNVIVYPLDLVITRLQAQRRRPLGSPPETEKQVLGNDVHADDSSHATNKSRQDEDFDSADPPTSIPSTIKHIYTTAGPSGFYAGLAQDTLKSIIDSFLFFLFYNLLWHLNHRRFASPSSSSSKPAKAALGNTTRKLGTEVAMGVLAGPSTKALTSPIQQVVTRMQTQSRTRKKSGESEVGTSRAIVKDIYTQRGISGFWAGYTASLLLTLNPSLTFLIDSLLRRILTRRAHHNSTTSTTTSTSTSQPTLTPSTTFLTAALGKATASTLMYPLSLSKTRAQLSGQGNVAAAIRGIVAAEGVGALCTGLGGEVLKGFLGHGLTMLVKERVVRGLVGVWGVLWRWVVLLRQWKTRVGRG